jgi:hypothetical protein
MPWSRCANRPEARPTLKPRSLRVIHDGRWIATLELQPLPDYCPNCDPNVVPFWGVTAWQLYPSTAASDLAAPTPTRGSGALFGPRGAGAVPG